MKKNKIVSSMLLLLLLFSMTACNPARAKNSNSSDINLTEGQTYNIPVNNDETSFISQDDSVADVDEYGVVLANSVGKTVITAKNAQDIQNYTVSVSATENTQNGLFGQFEDINNSTSYIGCGYNVINSPYINSNSVNIENPIFDREKLKKAKLSKATTDILTKVTEVSGDTMASLMSDMANKLNVNASASYKEYFSASVNTEFSTMAKKNSVSKEYFMKMYASTQSMALSLSGSRSKQIDYVDEDFYEDLKKLNIDDLFEIYGTHVIISATYGGRLDFSYYMSTDEKTTSQQDLMNIGAKISSKVAGFSAEASADIKQSYATDATSKNIKVQMASSTLGGDTYAMRNEADLANNYAKWINSVKEKPAIIGIPNSRSLKPIWELLPDDGECKMRRQKIKARFEELGAVSYKSLLDSYGIAPQKPEISDGMIEFGEYPQSRASRPVEEALNKIVGDFPDENTFVYENKKYYRFVPRESTAGYDAGKAYFFLIEPIMWKFLSSSGGGSQVISSKVLDAGVYLNEYAERARRNKPPFESPANWETSDVRKYLNEDFYNLAFNTAEKATIRYTKALNDPTRKYEKAFTLDTVSIFADNNEIKKHQAVFDAIREVTDFAEAKGLTRKMICMRYSSLRRPNDHSYDNSTSAFMFMCPIQPCAVAVQCDVTLLTGYCPIITLAV